MTLKDRNIMTFRLPADQMRRLDAAAQYSGQTKQTFVQHAVMAEVAEVEEKRRTDKRRGSRLTLRKPIADDDDESLLEPKGLGLADRLQAPAPPQPIEQEIEDRSRQVVVNVGAQSGSSGPATGGGEVISRFARFVLAGPDYERSTRLRSAKQILRTSAASEEEYKVLAAQLEAAISTDEKKHGTGVVRALRLGFDKLNDLLGGSDK